MGSQESSWNSRVTATVLSLIAIPLLIMVAYYASRTLVPSLSKLQFSLPTETSAISQSLHTTQHQPFNGTAPAFLKFSFPGFPRITFADILIFFAVLIVVLAFLQAFRVISNRRTLKPVSDIDLLIEERNRVATIIDETVRKLSLGSNHRDTVLNCYKLITETLEVKSSVDGRALTASEFMKIVSQRLKFDSPSFSRVTSLFEVARYSENEVTSKDAGDAIECLSLLSSELKALDLSARSGEDRNA